ncbi:hypothetical protein HPB51_019657 [Rhipicephalus microplus]|uniref:Uncharacterized protein n=1 Tax=Rhipicephalus microplus TaxID=6941 RepID=A0A9J6EAT1_RHIMP|nr:hypothetical protein HPB51_019657 [Rhipicephalus microplus]
MPRLGGLVAKEDATWNISVRWSRQIALALTKNNTLAQLSLVSLSLEDKDIELITRLPSQNRTLTRVNVTRCAVRGASSLAAFTENKTLEELTLDLSTFHTNGYNSLFRALASNPCLKKVTVELFKQEDVSEICRAIRETGVTGALLRRNTLRSLEHRSKTKTEMLADTWQSSATLCELFFFPHYIERVIALMRKLSPNISNNYTLLDMRVYPLPLPSSDRFNVADVIRRNRTLVMRAAHFVTGARLKYCAAAAELVHSNPGLKDHLH